jgi:AcrR family transcriptional regulator
MSGEPHPEEAPLPLPPWERSRRKTAPARVPLTRERIVDAAFAVLDREGYERMSMRQVAAELGVAVSALYAHVQGKDELLELMYTRFFSRLEIPDPDPARWREQVKAYAVAQRRLLLQHRDLARLSMGMLPFSTALLPQIERVYAIFRAAGIPDRVAALAGDMLSTFVEGFVYEESMWQQRVPNDAQSWDDLRAQMREYFTSLPADRFPNMVALADHMLSQSQETRFDDGVEIILRGLASYRETPADDAERG